MLPFSLLPTPSRLAVRALNGMLSREDWARDRLARHAGKTVRFVFGRFIVGLAVSHDGYADLADSAVVPDVTLTINPSKLNPLGMLPGQERPDVAEATHIEGDAALARVVADLAANLRWDPEDELARWVGDVPATRLIASARLIHQGSTTAISSVGRNVSEYLAEESNVLAGTPLLTQWQHDLTHLNQQREALSRQAAALEARVARLSAKQGI